MAAALGLGDFVSDRRDRVFWAAVVFSIVLHAVLFGTTFFLKKPRMDVVVPGPIVARLVAPLAAPAPAEEPAPRAEERPALPLPPPPPQKASPVPVPAVPSKAPQTAPAPKAEVPPPLAAPATPSAPPSSGTASPSTAPPAAAASPAAPSSAPPETVAKVDPQAGRGAPSAPAPSQEDAGTIDQYRLDIIKAATLYKTNPRVPGMRDIKEARADVRMVIGTNGMIASISIQKSAGHPILDKNSIETLRRAKGRVLVPSALRGKEFSIDVPFIYQLQDEGA